MLQTCSLLSYPFLQTRWSQSAGINTAYTRIRLGSFLGAARTVAYGAVEVRLGFYVGSGPCYFNIKSRRSLGVARARDGDANAETWPTSIFREMNAYRRQEICHVFIRGDWFSSCLNTAIIPGIFEHVNCLRCLFVISLKFWEDLAKIYVLSARDSNLQFLKFSKIKKHSSIDRKMGICFNLFTNSGSIKLMNTFH